MRTRQTARVLVLDEQQRLLLFHIQDTVALHEAHPDMLIYWLTPGGGVEPNESHEEAARRELWEETGLTVDPLGPPVWHHERVLLMPRSGPILLQEQFFVAQLIEPKVSLANLLPYERKTHQAYQWWPLAEIQKSKDYFLPIALSQHLPAIIEGDRPAKPYFLSS
jgi:8-oxo-dGTP pyrophosphatase MutT (NUDIX family)